jgi:hypothetical protein
MLDDSALSRAKAALRAGECATARALLLQLTEARPDWADAWLWLAAASADADWKRTYLERVLHLNPGDSRAIAALRAMGHAPPTVSSSHAAPAVSDAARDAPTAQRPMPRSGAQLPATDLLALPRFRHTGVRARHLSWQFVALLAALVVLIPLALSYLRT